MNDDFKLGVISNIPYKYCVMCGVMYFKDETISKDSWDNRESCSRGCGQKLHERKSSGVIVMPLTLPMKNKLINNVFKRSNFKPVSRRTKPEICFRQLDLFGV